MEVEGRAYGLGFVVTGDEKKDRRRFDALLFSMRRTEASLGNSSHVTASN